MGKIENAFKRLCIPNIAFFHHPQSPIPQVSFSPRRGKKKKKKKGNQWEFTMTPTPPHPPRQQPSPSPAHSSPGDDEVGMLSFCYLKVGMSCL